MHSPLESRYAAALVLALVPISSILWLVGWNDNAVVQFVGACVILRGMLLLQQAATIFVTGAATQSCVLKLVASAVAVLFTVCAISLAGDWPAEVIELALVYFLKTYPTHDEPFVAVVTILVATIVYSWVWDTIVEKSSDERPASFQLSLTALLVLMWVVASGPPGFETETTAALADDVPGQLAAIAYVLLMLILATYLIFSRRRIFDAITLIVRRTFRSAIAIWREPNEPL